MTPPVIHMGRQGRRVTVYNSGQVANDYTDRAALLSIISRLAISLQDGVEFLEIDGVTFRGIQLEYFLNLCSEAVLQNALKD